MKQRPDSPLPYPVADDTGNTATIVGETSTVNELDVTANQVVLEAYKLTSGLIKASVELMQDSAFDLDGYVASVLASGGAVVWKPILLLAQVVDNPLAY